MTRQGMRIALVAVAAAVAAVAGLATLESLSRAPSSEPPGASTAAATAPAPTAGPSAPSSGPMPDPSVAVRTAATTAAPRAAAPPPTAAASTPPASAAAASLTSRPTSTAVPSPAGQPAPAPTSGAGFQPRRTVVSMGFPLPAISAYRYGDAWRVPRLGVVYPYNQIRGVTPAGTMLRAHDGFDLPVRNGTRVLAPFAGVVVNPAAIWKPWDPQRYGTVVVVRSAENGSRGYYALMAHLSRRDVEVGDRVRRGQAVGLTGQTGNAGGTPPHLHFELRAPFPIAYAYAGVRRSLDVFDPLPSLLAADPKRS